MSTMSVREKAVVHVINKFKVKKQNQAFRCILIYQDLDTGFCFVKPLLYKIDLEIVLELFKIFTSYGPPAELHVNSCNQEMVDNMAAHIKALCPMFDITFIKKNADNNDIAMKVVSKLHKWMENTGKDEWEIGCSIVQRDINTEVTTEAPLTPHERFFKRLEIDSAAEIINQNTSVAQEQNISVTRDQSRSDTQERNISVTRDQSRSDTQEQNISVTRDQSRSDTQEQNISVTRDQSRSDTQEQNISVTRDQNRSNTQEQKIPVMQRQKSVTEKQNSSLQEKPSSINHPVGRVRIKEEIIDEEQMNNQIIILDEGLIIPSLKKENTHIEIKMERMDE